MNLNDDIVATYLAGSDYRGTAELFGVSTWKVGDALRRARIRPRSFSEVTRNQDVDHSYFRTVDTEAKAYWLGFMNADGSVCRARHHLRLAMYMEDEAFVRAFADAVGLKDLKVSAPSIGRPRVRAAFGSKEMASGLSGWGVPPDIDGGLLRHFWRGMVDGDGCLFDPLGEDARVNLGGTKLACDAFLDFVRSCGVETKADARPHTGGCWCASVAGRRRAAATAALLYDGASVFLPRKKEAANAMILNWHQTTRRTSC